MDSSFNADQLQLSSWISSVLTHPRRVLRERRKGHFDERDNTLLEEASLKRQNFRYTFTTIPETAIKYLTSLFPCSSISQDCEGWCNHLDKIFISTFLSTYITLYINMIRYFIFSIYCLNYIDENILRILFHVRKFWSPFLPKFWVLSKQ